MAWWTAVPALTPLVAHDVLRVSATHFLDAVGGNDMALGGCTPSSAYPFYTYAGAGAAMPYASPVAMPPIAVLVTLRKAASNHIAFYGTGGYALGQEADGRMYTNGAGGDGLLALAGVVALGALGFTALVKGASTTQLYHNGGFVGNTVANAKVMSTVDGVGYLLGADYCFDANDAVSAFGVFSGVPTLAEMQALEAAVRAELAAPQPSTSILAFAPLASSVGAQAVGAPTSRVVDVGRVRALLGPVLTGLGQVSGVVTVNNVPAAKQVRLYDKLTGGFVAETQSAANGVYNFFGINADREYFVVGHDASRTYNAVISDMVAP